MIQLLTTLIILGLIGWIVVKFIPMIEPVRTIVIVVFALIAITYLVKFSSIL